VRVPAGTLLLTATLALAACRASPPVVTLVADFQADAPGQPPSGFTTARTGGGTPGAWLVVPGDAPGARVLAQTSADATDLRFPLCVRADLRVRDASLRVAFQAREGTVDRAAGLVVRYQGPDDYYVARANALEDNVRLYHVVGGRRTQFAGADVPVRAGVWHELRLDVRGADFAVFLDGRCLFTARDETLSGPGGIGLWTKADSVTWFDDLRLASVPAEGPFPGP